MKKLIFRSLMALGIIIILAIAYFFIFVYFKPHVDYLKTEHEIEVSGQQLYNDFVSDHMQAARKYSGKVLLVNGIIDDLELVDDMQIAVMIFDDGFFGPEGVRFSLLEGQAAKIVPGTNMYLKGFCTGYTGSDVIIEHASVVQELNP